MLPFLVIGFAVCVAAAVADFQTARIPNWLTYPVLLLSPPAHLVFAAANGADSSAAFRQGALSLAGAALCGVVPLYMWKRGALGGGDVKLFAALGALGLPRFGIETQMYVFCVAALAAPAHLIYRARFRQLLCNVLVQVTNPFRSASERRRIDPALTSWFRLGPCFAIGFALQVALRFGPITGAGVEAELPRTLP